MATVYAPIAKDSSINTTESPSRNIADVLAEELSEIANAITGGSDKAPKTDIATVEPSNTASRAYSVGELVYVNGNLYKVITAISIGATFTVGTNIQSTNVSSICEEFRGEYETLTVNGTADSNGNLSIAVIGSKKIYGAFFHPSADSYGVVVVPWVYPTYGGVLHLHAMEYTGAPAAGATLKGDLNIYYKAI